MRALTIALCLLAAPALADVAGVASVKRAALAAPDGGGRPRRAARRRGHDHPGRHQGRWAMLFCKIGLGVQMVLRAAISWLNEGPGVDYHRLLDAAARELNEHEEEEEEDLPF